MTSKRITIVFSLALLLGAVGAAWAEMSVAEYVDLAIERLEMARTSWADEGRAPTADEEAALCEAHGISGEAFYAFAGKHRDEIAAYLDDNPELAETIQSLSDEIAALVEPSEADE